MAITLTEMKAIIDGIAPAVRDHVDQQLVPLRQQIAALEQRPALKHLGTYRDGAAYVEGNLVTRNGGLWLCLQNTVEPPGKTPAAWQLIVKSGGA
jgi:hypothetical protein